MAISQRRVTLEEFLALPEEKPVLEYIDGWVRQKAMPKGPHGTLQSWLAHIINAYAIGSKLAWAYTETRVLLGGNAPVPDLIVYRWERIPRDSNGRIAEDFITPPDLAVEILSPGQSQTDLAARCRWYLEQGVQVSLLIHPGQEWVWLFGPGAAPVRLRDDDPIELECVLPGFRLTARELFAALRPG